ncbi:hypothetical protein [Paraburkholderia antibiotica]|uniref:Uncharacterized protein n=1 Tax=Paraburkholderia antibiotica TaxID=2728839 RepID=A0A7X9X8Q0_9BURK|nr:hypothetical protein [Paraburkholderia antibiotica]NML33572.1 hypothetical protein [Paraburkholderia antibiotica]
MRTAMTSRRCPLSALFGEYRGKSLEDSAELAELMADLPADAQRAAMRMISEFAGVVREREELRRQVDFLRVRIAKMERDILNDMLDREPKPSRPKKSDPEPLAAIASLGRFLGRGRLSAGG